MVQISRFKTEKPKKKAHGFKRVRERGYEGKEGR